MRRRIHVHEHTGELNIVPYLDIVVNLVMFILLSMAGLISLGVLTVSAPKISGEGAGGAQADDKPKLLLTVAVGKQGFYIAGAGGVLGADASSADTTRPPTIPLRDGRYDYAALTESMKVIKGQFPNETQLILSAVYDVLVQTMDACREYSAALPGGGSERKPLFFDVSLSLVG